MSYNLEAELKKLKNEKKIYEHQLKNHQKKMKILLETSMGNDINDVLDGKIKIKLSLKEKIMFKIKNFFFFIFKIF